MDPLINGDFPFTTGSASPVFCYLCTYGFIRDQHFPLFPFEFSLSINDKKTKISTTTSCRTTYIGTFKYSELKSTETDILAPISVFISLKLTSTISKLNRVYGKIIFFKTNGRKSQLFRVFRFDNLPLPLYFVHNFNTHERSGEDDRK